MMVPSNRLIGLAALVITPALTLLTLGGGSSRYGLMIACAAAGLALLDWVLSLDLLSDLDISVNSPLRAIVGRPFDFEIVAVWKRHQSATLHLDFDVPDALVPISYSNEWQFESITSTEGQDQPQVLRRRIQAQSVAHQRGRHRIVHLTAQCTSRLGLWWVRCKLPTNICIHGYPDLHRDQRLLAASNTALAQGAMTSVLAGRGRSFDRLREYVPGDQLDDIHWRATAKRHRPITKLYQLEKDQRIYVAVDQSRLSSRASPRDHPAEPRPLPLLERYINTALMLGAVAQTQGDQFGLLGFSDQVTSFVPAGNGPAHYKACREAVLEFQPRRVNSDYRELFSFFGNKVRRRSMLFVLTSVDDPALCEELIESAKIISDRHWVVAAAVAPNQVHSLADAEPIESPDQIIDRLESHLLWKRLRHTARQLEQSGIHFLSLRHESMVVNVVASYARTKRGQLL